MEVPEQSRDESSDVESHPADTNINNSQKVRLLRYGVQGVNQGLVTTASLMMGVGAVNQDAKAMSLYGFAGLVAVAIGQFVSIYSQMDIEVAQMKREKEMKEGSSESEEQKGDMQWHSPLQAAAVLALTFLVGGMVPLLVAASIKPHKVRPVMVAAVTLALAVFGGLRAKLGREPVGKSCLIVIVGGWLAMLVNFGLMKLFSSYGL